MTCIEHYHTYNLFVSWLLDILFLCLCLLGPSAPRHFNVSRISSTIVVCEWLPPSRPNGIIVSYSVEVCNNSLFCFRVNTSDNATSLMINSLQPFTNYSFAVQASTSVGAGPASESVNTQTFQAGKTFSFLFFFFFFFFFVARVASLRVVLWY